MHGSQVLARYAVTSILKCRSTHKQINVYIYMYAHIHVHTWDRHVYLHVKLTRMRIEIVAVSLQDDEVECLLEKLQRGQM